VSVHSVALRNRSIEIEDDLRYRIKLLDGANELKTFARVALRGLRIADHKRKFRNDIELANATGKFQSLFSLEVLIHLLEYPVRPGFRPKEDHRAARSPNSFESSVRETKHQVDTGFAPPAQSQRRYAVRQFPCVVLAQKEIIVIELEGIRT